MDRLARKNEFKLYNLQTPIGTQTTNSRKSMVISELSGATEVIICVKTTSAATLCYQSHFVKYDGVETYSDYFYQRPPNNDYGLLYDVQWVPANNEVNIRTDFVGSSNPSTTYPMIYAVLYM